MTFLENSDQLQIQALRKEIAKLREDLDIINSKYIRLQETINEQKLTEMELLKSNEQYKMMFDSIDEGFCIIQMRIEPDKPLDYRFVEVNKAFERQSTLTDARGKWMREMRPEHEESWFEIYRDVALNGTPIRFESEGKALENRWFTLYAFRIGNPEEHLVAVLFNDITRNKKIEDDLRQALLQAEEGKNTLSALMEYIPLGITIADAPDVNIRMVSRYGQQILEKTSDEIAGIPAPEHPSKWGVYRADGKTPGTPEELPLSRATMKGEIVKNEEWFVTRKDGTLVPILCNAAPILDKYGKVIGGIIGWQDIAEIKKIEMELNQRNEELTMFIYTVSHDLKKSAGYH